MRVSTEHALFPRISSLRETITQSRHRLPLPSLSISQPSPADRHTYLSAYGLTPAYFPTAPLIPFVSIKQENNLLSSTSNKAQSQRLIAPTATFSKQVSKQADYLLAHPGQPPIVKTQSTVHITHETQYSIDGVKHKKASKVRFDPYFHQTSSTSSTPCLPLYFQQ